MKGYIKRLLREGSYDKPVKYGKDIVDRIREINPSIDKELDNSIFSKSDKVYCKGGAARLALLIFCDIDNNGGLHGSDIIRDSDFVYIGGYNRSVDIGEVEFIDSYDKYFSSRDITLNEVLLSPTELIFTRRAYRDGKKEVINPSKSSNTEGKYKVVDGRLLARMFLFASRYGYKPVATLKYDYDENDTYINFDILVCLLKAYELGIEDRYFRMFKEYCGNFNFNDFGSWLASLITINFDFFGREDLLINDLSKINDSEIEDYLDEYFYKYYPELKKKVNRLQLLQLDDSDFKEYLTKPNRGEQNPKMRRSVNMSLAENIKRLLREGLEGVQYIYHGDVEDDDAYDRYEIEANVMANNHGIGLGSNDLAYIALMGDKLIGATWIGVAGVFSFDIVVDSEYQGSGVGGRLIDMVFKKYDDRKNTIYGGGEYPIRLNVVNTGIKDYLLNKYGKRYGLVQLGNEPNILVNN